MSLSAEIQFHKDNLSQLPNSVPEFANILTLLAQAQDNLSLYAERHQFVQQLHDLMTGEHNIKVAEEDKQKFDELEKVLLSSSSSSPSALLRGSVCQSAAQHHHHTRHRADCSLCVVLCAVLCCAVGAGVSVCVCFSCAPTSAFWCRRRTRTCRPTPSASRKS
jgi:hypothetical protein